MRLPPAARAVLEHFRRRMRALWRARHSPHRPTLTDRSFLESLRPVSEPLAASRASLDAGDETAAMHRAVEHFLQRSSPAFFLDFTRIASLAERLKHERPAYVAALRATVDADLHRGLRLLSRRGPPLASGFDWSVSSAPGDDVLYAVQPHRFGFMPLLALAAHYGVDTLPVIDEVTDRWVVRASIGDPLAYLSPLVVQYRVVASTWTFAFVAALHGASRMARHAVLSRLLKIIRADMVYLAGVTGSSYPNNHLLADGFGAWYCGTLYPEFAGAEALREKGESIFLAELTRQFLADGSSFEHSMHYHELGCEMAVAYVLLSRRNGQEPPAAATSRLERMLAFQSALGGPEAVALQIGDGTEDPLFPLDPGCGPAPGAMRELYRILFDSETELPPPSDLTVARTWWLLGEIAPQARPPAVRQPSVSFEQGGFYVMADSQLKSRLVFRSGPAAGMPISAGHAHADILSIYVTVEGVPLIVGSGTYTYRFGTHEAGQNWRAYFAGPAAHNGLIFSGDPYGRIQGDFRDRDVPCRVGCRQHVADEHFAWLECEVEGDNVAAGHRRGIVHVAGHYWLVYDVVPEQALATGVSLALQFAPGSDAELVSCGSLLVQLGDSACTLALSAGLVDAVLLTGSLDPLGGWVAPRYGERVPAPQLRARLEPTARAYGFVVKPMCDPRSRDLAITATATDSCLAFRIADGAFVDTLLVRTAATGPWAAWGIESDGAHVWQRTHRGEVVDRRTW